MHKVLGDQAGGAVWSPFFTGVEPRGVPERGQFNGPGTTETKSASSCAFGNGRDFLCYKQFAI